MPALRISTALDPAELLARATDGLFPLAAPSDTHPWPTLPAWLVLRQGGLRDDVHRAAAAHGVAGWFDPPVCLFAELPTRWGAPGDRPLSEEERIALLTWVIDRHADGVFDRHGSADAWVPAIDRLIGELVGEGITHQTFTQIMSAREGRDAFEQLRDTRLAAIYADWDFALRQRGRIDGRDGLVRLAQFVARDADAFSRQLGGRRDIRIVGLADLRGGWRPLLAALAACPALDAITVFTSSPLELPTSFNAVHTADAIAESLAATLFTDGVLPPDLLRDRVHLLEAPDSTREIEHVAVRVRQLLDRTDAPLAPDRIAVVMRSARPGVDRMADALEALGVPVTARRRTALLQTGPAHAVRALLTAASEGFTRHAVVELAEHPLLALTLDADVLHAVARTSPVASLEGWEPALRALLRRCELRDAHPENWKANRGLPLTAPVQATIDAWMAWLPLARAMSRDRTTAEWFALVREVLTDDAWGVAVRLDHAPAGDVTVWRADVLACARIIALADEWSRALLDLQISEAPCSASAFADRLTLVLSADLITQPHTAAGVVVSEALAAGWRSFDHVFVVGLSAGEFPRRQPPSALLSDRDRRALIAAGLPLDAPERWRAREQELFRVLCAAPRVSLTLSWPSMDSDGREVARSSYAEDVIDLIGRSTSHFDDDALEAAGMLMRVPTQQMVTPGFPLLARDHAHEALVHATRIAAQERDRSRAGSPYNGHIEDPALLARLSQRFGEEYPWSASQLEGLAKCSWSFFSSRVLGLDTRADLTDDMEPTTRGTVLHEALRIFFEEVQSRLATGLLLSSHSASVQPIIDHALDAAWNAQMVTSWMGNPALHPIVRNELRAQLTAYIAFEIHLNDSHTNNRTKASKQVRMAVQRGEFAFEQVTIEGNGVRFRIRGSVDRMDIGSDDRLTGSERYFAAIDYKSSISSTPAGGKPAGWTDGVVLQVPLYAKALQTHFPDLTLARLEYRTLRSPKVVHQLQFVAMAKDKTTTEAVADATTQLHEAIEHAGRFVGLARAGRFAASPAPSCGCSPYCVARDICRLPGGPENDR